MFILPSSLRTLALLGALVPATIHASAAAEVTVRIDNFAFVPDVATIHPGDTIVWKNADDIPHSIVSSKPGAFRSRALDTEDSYAFTFKDGGVFDYFCGLHPHMKGKIIVAP